jgi:type III secretory pathway component EscU
MYLLIAREREEISQKFQRIWIQQAKTIFSMQKISEKLRCTVKNTQKLSLLIFWFRVKILKNENSGIPK